jgi:hypothetical protein
MNSASFYKENVRLRQALCEHNTFKTALQISHEFKQFSDVRLRAYMIVANLLDESVAKGGKGVAHSDTEWRKQLEHISLVIGDLVAYTGMGAQRLLNNSAGGEIERCPLAGNSGNDTDSKSEQANSSEVVIIEINGVIFYLTEFLDVLYNFAAVSDEIKRDIYATDPRHGMCTHLRAIIKHGNGLEREHALKLLCQLCFEPKNARDVADDHELCEFLNGLLKIASNSCAEDDEQVMRVQNNVKKIFFVLNKKSETKQEGEANVASKSAVRDEDKHVMISYNSKSREMCLKVKAELEAAGHSVWIDVESIYGSSLEAMAEAIEKCKCVLVCITEKYKESNYCRLEAEYLMQQKKPFIPLLSKIPFHSNNN